MSFALFFSFSLEVLERTVIKHQPGLHGLKGKRAVLVSELLQQLGNPVLDPEVLFEAGDRGYFRRDGAGAVQPGGNAVVSKLCMVPDKRSIHVGPEQSSLLAHNQFDNHRLPVRCIVEGRKVRRKLFRQHGKYPGGGIDRCSIPARVLVDR
jgi:hypothetical protein